ncbi:hypothetical protein Q5752_005394 [Cryptotrichosporon argae]
MTTPSSALPSPTLSASSQHHQSFSSLQQRTHSSASGSHHGHSTPSEPRVPVPGPGHPSALGLEDFRGLLGHVPPPPPAHYGDAHATPHAALAQPQPSTQQFVPPMTTSPPPHVPSYVPPALYAMAPDPIHGGGAIGWGAPGAGAGAGSAGPWRAGQYGYRGANGHAGPPGASGHAPPNPLDGYPSSRASMSSTPGLQGMGYGRSGSSAGEPRERRRYRDDGEDDEVISTIFVVGFPEDMMEREFQNLFTFAPGFEAATLKFPSGMRREAAFLDQLNRLEISQGQLVAGGYEHDPALGVQNLEDSIASLTTSSTPSAAMSLTPSAPSTATLGPSSGLTRRQTIGFARFKTRADAFAARDLLQGRRIDPLTGATLKAEMAKKNLHTKRQPAQDDVLSLALRSSRLSQLGAQQVHALAGQPVGLPLGVAAYGAMPPPASAPAAPGPSAREAWESWPNASAPAPPAGGNKQPDRSMPPPPLPHFSSSSSSIPAGSSQSHGSGSSPPLSVQSPVGRPADSKELLKYAEQADELAGDVWPPNLNDYNGYAGPTPPPGPAPRGPAAVAGPTSAPIGIAGGGTSAAYGQYAPYGAYQQAGFGASPPADGVSLSINPADQNPPINTLYIGNLPATQSRDYPPNFLEESLRALFNMCPGFKRMSFRQKINGPMCFVEFEDVAFAAQAIHDLYGNTLHGMVKGGIRLSYSKNSLGQRGNAHSQGANPALFGGLAHTVALAGMTAAAAPGAALGPNSAASVGAGAGASTSPPFHPQMSDRRPSEASSLSPTAQPFNAPLPTSPRANRYFTAAQPIPKPLSPPSEYLQQPSFSPTSPIRTPASLGWLSSANGFSSTAAAGNGVSSAAGVGVTVAGGSASSASSGGANGFGQSPGFASTGVFEPFGASQSLNGAASAWGGSL